MKLTLRRLDLAIEQVLADATGEAEEHAAFAEALQRHVKTPCNALVLGAEVILKGFDYNGNERRGVTAKCIGVDGRKYQIAAADVELPHSGVGQDYLAVYRRWVGLTPYPRASRARAADAKSQTVKLILLAPIKYGALACRVPGSGQTVTLRLMGSKAAVPGEILTVEVRKVHSRSGHDSLTGVLLDCAFDVQALELTPLALRDCGMWDPKEHDWGEEDVPAEKWEQAQQMWGPRPQFEMEQILPGNDLDDPDGDPILRAMDLAGPHQLSQAFDMLYTLCRQELRCLDAHAHLGNLCFDQRPELAVRHYEVGVRIGELSLGENFRGLLPWGMIDNRPFLRCMIGYGLCLWRLSRFEEAAKVFDQMLWFNPSDNQGVRFLIGDVAEHRPWRPDY